MKLAKRKRLPCAVMAGTLLFAAVICVYTALVLENTKENEIKSSQQTSSALLLSLSKGALTQNEAAKYISFQKASRTFFTLRDHARALRNRINSPQEAPISFFGFDYFAKNGEPHQVFYSPQSYPEGTNCLELAGIPSSYHQSFTAFLKNEGFSPERFKCFKKGSQDFFGYLMESASGRHVTYLYLEKYKPSAEFQEPQDVLASFEKVQSVLADAKFAVFNEGQKIYASSGFNIENLPDDLKASNGETKLTLGSDGQKAEVTARCDGKLCVLIQDPAFEISNQVIMSLVIALLFTLLIIFGIFVNMKRQEEDLKRCKLDDATDVRSLVTFINSHSSDEKLSWREMTDGSVVKNALNDAAKAHLEHCASLEKQHDEQMRKLKEQAEQLEKKAFAQGKADELFSFQNMLPPVSSELPTSRFLDISSLLMPSKQGCSDAYDIFRTDKDNLAFMMGSCTRKGCDALKMLNESLTLGRRLLRDEGFTPDEAFNEINKLLLERNREGAGLKMFAMILSEFTGNFICCSAGFTPPVISSMSGTAQFAAVNGRALGENPQEKYVYTKGKLDFGDSLLLSGPGVSMLAGSDGLPFGSERVAQAFASAYEGSSRDMMIRIMKTLHNFSNDVPSKDLCLICIKKTNNTNTAQE